MKVTLEDALSLLSKYAKERTPVLAILGTPSLSVARVAGTIRVSIVGGVPCVLIGKRSSESDQIKFWLSDCEFAYGDFRDERRLLVKGDVTNSDCPDLHCGSWRSPHIKM